MKKLLLVCIVLFSSAFSINVFSQKLTIAVSANAQYLLKDLAEEFQKHNHVEINLIPGSSGKLTIQIIQGAPYNLFFSADIDYPKLLSSKGLTTGEMKIYGYGSLVLWTFKDINLSTNLDVLKSTKIKRIALANPKTSPYGKEMIDILKKTGLYEKIRSKVIFGESLSLVNHYIVSGNCDIGITAKSIVLTSRLKDKGKWIEIDQNVAHPIPQGVVIIKSQNKEENFLSDNFLKFIFTNEGKKVLEKNGYLLNKE